MVGDPVALGEDFRIPARMQALKRGGEWRRVHDRCVVFTRNPDQAAQLKRGTRWECSGLLTPRQDPHVGLHASSWRITPDEAHLQSLPPGVWSAAVAALFDVRFMLLQQIERQLSEWPEEAAMLQALLLGNREALPELDEDRFARTGLIHIFAVSGLHIGMLAMLMWWGLRLFGISYRSRIWWMLPLLSLFVWFSGARASSLRALIMITCVMAAPWVYRRLDLRQGLYLACCVILLISPEQVLDIGFQFSFLLTAGLMAMVQENVRFLETMISPDPWAPFSGARHWRHRVLWPWIIGSLVVSFWSMILSAPLTAWHFNVISPVGVLGNLVAVPLVFLLLLTGMPALFCSFIPLPGMDALLWVPALFARGLREWSVWMDQIPAGWSWVKAPPGEAVLAFYVLLGLSWALPRWRPVCWWGISACLTFVGVQRWVDHMESEFVLLPADRGQSFFLRKGGEDGVLIDTGGVWEGRRCSRWLQEQGIDRLEAVILTHPDRNHTGGWREAVERVQVDRLVFFSGDADTYDVASPVPALHPVAGGDRMKFGGWTVEVLSPEKGTSPGRSDERSLVIRMVSDAHAFLFLGGAGETVEHQVLQADLPLEARVLCAGNPRSGNRVTEPFLQAVRPEWVAFSGESYGGPSPERRQAEQRVHALGIQVLRSQERQPVHIHF